MLLNYLCKILCKGERFGKKKMAQTKSGSIRVLSALLAFRKGKHSISQFLEMTPEQCATAP